MERRLNCYNYIFGDCVMGKKCPYGHVIVSNKEDYKRRLELNIDHTSDRTSPKGSQFINYDYPIEANKEDKDYQLAPPYVCCFYCKNLKILKRTANKKKDYVCKECREKIAHEYINKSILRGGEIIR
jgi:hypothetical protein